MSLSFRRFSPFSQFVCKTDRTEITDPTDSTLSRFIRFRRDPVQGLLKLEPLGFQIRLHRVRRDPDRLPPQEQPSAKRIRDHEAVPARKDFFFEQLNVSGTIGRPVAFASWITPIWATCRGPFGPSGVTTKSTPERPSSISCRRAVTPPRVVDPLTERNPKWLMVRWINSPSRC